MLFKIIMCCVSFALFANAETNVKSNNIKIAMIDMDKIASSSNMIRELKQKLTRLNSEYSKEWQEKQNKLNSEFEALKKKQELAKNDSEKNALKESKNQLIKQQESFQKEVEAKSEEMNSLKNNIIEKFQQKVIKESEKITNKNSNMIIISVASVVAFSKDNAFVTNVTDQIIQELNKDDK
ncbi:OmpH family outer membrane protein [Candidatus Cytomitobacter primus]|uniref:OmpH family outer membrane protein n=1 Tax=Candidatus Cytomitobacter primus TaxID=2066024 RepID=A0A5C0UFD3_9PROT|nr:OmpH family outer membrane protein [Candidatus Cytomitobacter primus]QEK38768.1 OmpH family outer membrane protein [Candidatus Cytomitobacter primus]